MLSSVEQAFVGRDEKRAPPKTPAWEAILGYAAQIWQDIPAYLSDAIESIQRRALRIIFPNSSYQQALDQANLTCR